MLREVIDVPAWVSAAMVREAKDHAELCLAKHYEPADYVRRVMYSFEPAVRGRMIQTYGENGAVALFTVFRRELELRLGLIDDPNAAPPQGGAP